MSETPELPPLPEPFKVLLGPLPVFTAQQMREQWAAGRRAGLEEAAKLCYEVDAKLFAEALVCTAGDCAEAIREACGGTGRAKP